MAAQGYDKAMRWIRKSHGWIGMWGAMLGLLFGFSGIWLNHRTVLKLPVTQHRSTVRMALPDPVPASPDAMQTWLRKALGIERGANSTKINHAKPVAWAEGNAPQQATLMQPEHWVFSFGGPNELVQVEYWLGNRSVGVTTTANGVLATLNNLHKGTGMSVLWILLVDTLAGSMIFLSISGVLLWVQFNRRRAIGVAIFSASLGLTLGLALDRL